jgi:hypothetical protein
MKIKRGRLQQIIREELTRVLSEQADNDLDTDNDGMISADELEAELEDIKDDLGKVDFVDVENGEVLYVGAGTDRGIPAAKVLKFMGISSDDPRLADPEPSIQLSKADFEKLEDHIDKVYDRPEREKADAARKAERQRTEPENVMKRVEDWASSYGAGFRQDAASGDQPAAFDPTDEGINFVMSRGSTAGLKPDEFEALLAYYEDMAEKELELDNPTIGALLATRKLHGGATSDDVAISDAEKKMRYNDVGVGWTATKYAEEGLALQMISDFVANSMA